MTQIWNVVLLQPMLNALLLLYGFFGQNFAVAIAILTIMIRLITLPLTLPQQKSAKKMAAIQPELQALQKKYKDDKERLAKEQMALYKTAGVNPLGGCLPLLIQFPIWIALYQSISQALATNPLQLLDLSANIYRALPWVSSLVPLRNTFLWLDLAKPDPIYILPVLVVAHLVPAEGDDCAVDGPAVAVDGPDNQVMMPLMLGFFSLQFSSGLALYFVMSNIVGVVIQYFTPGWVGVSLGRKPAGAGRRRAARRRRAAAKLTGHARKTLAHAVRAGGRGSKKGQRYGKEAKASRLKAAM